MRDLLPSYVEKLTSEETNRVMEEHFDGCTECASERDAMRQALHNTDTIVWKNQKTVDYLKKAKVLYILKGILLSAGIIGIIVSFIVDIAVNRRLTWSLLVDVSIIYLYACVLPLFSDTGHKIMKSLAAASLFAVPYLYAVEAVINKNYLDPPIYWAGRYALPISIIWIVIIWITVLIRHFAKVNLWTAAGILLLLATAGSMLTNAIARQAALLEIYTEGYEWMNMIIYLLCGILFLYLGHLWKNKR